MNTRPNDPLSPEERELAQLMGRLGPTGEPSPALDAKILAAAHAAATRKPAPARKPRWPVALGLAASVVFAVGIAWQLRPMQQVASVQEAMVSHPDAETPAADDHAAEVAAPGMVAEPSAQDATAAAAVDPVHAKAAPPPPEAPPSLAQGGRQQAPRSVSRPPPAMKAVAPVERREAYAPPPPPAPPAPAAPALSPAPAAQAFPADAESGALADSVVASEAAASSARDLAARQSSARTEMKAANAAAAREAESATLDRVEVTGSRLRTDMQVPVSEDARLEADAWLERVRTRYGLGDAEAARRSLLLFVKDHPDETVPEDLEPLLDE